MFIVGQVYFMKFDDQIEFWAKAHVFYNLFTQDQTSGVSHGITAESEWCKKMINETPNGHLLINNSFFKDLKNLNKINLLHITPSLSGILESGYMYASSGCLMGGIYATPLVEENDKFRVHNLGEYILKKEAPHATYLQSKGEKVSPLIIEIDLTDQPHSNLIGVDYLRMGDIHLNLYRELEYLLSFEERAKLQNVIIIKIKRSISYLSLVNQAYINNLELEISLFWQKLILTIDDLPILGYLYFEVVSEYLMLFQDFDEAKKYHEVGEFYNPTYKSLMFDLYPDLLNGAGLGVFKPSLDQIIDYINKKKLISNFNSNDMTSYIMKRLIFLTNNRFFNDNSNIIEFKNIRWDFDKVITKMSPLVGHLIHRELRNLGRFPDFYFYFDQFKALQIWNYWNHMDIEVPFNGVFPKGEVGINPAYPNLQYHIYRGEIVKGDAPFMYIKKGEELNIKIVPRLVHLRFATMRKRERNSSMN